ncbi:UDP-glycosyltransferase [Quillaja saponaria]|uniref:UDP-glycosyltransferase n=1 Tax=Quillaja saponaria TaxID=32244 RepID=A0AAD7LKK7_QUISA|nr:UDP-glycosyltransferase [Quillaja saponaria]
MSGLVTSDPTLKPDNIQFATIPNIIPPELLEESDYAGFNQLVMTKMEPLFEELLDRLKPPVNAIIGDVELGWPTDVGIRRNIPVALSWTMSSSFFSMSYNLARFRQNKLSLLDFSGAGDEFAVDIPGIPSAHLGRLRTVFDENDHKFLHLYMDAILKVQKAQYLIFSSVHELEPECFNSLKAIFPFPVYTIGPSIPYLQLKHTKFTSTADHNNHDNHLQWLDSQPVGSVLYISFGSFLSISDTQMVEIAAALKITGIRYFWVAREKENWLKENFGDHNEKGLIVPWCEQLKVLSHSSIGGFWSHCGWNSTLEALFAGVPILTFPLFLDQFPNSKQIVEDWKNGWEVKRTDELGNKMLVTKEEIAELVKRFMDFESTEGNEMRNRAKNLKDFCHSAIAKGGSSDSNLNAFMGSISSRENEY